MSALSLLAAEAPTCCDDETWEPIPDWPHEAGSCGRVRSLNRLTTDGRLLLGGILAPQVDKRPGKGYVYVVLRDGRRQRKVHLAVAVLEAHRGLRPGPGYEACHNHGIRTDNHLARLRWDTRAGNLADMAGHALARAVTEQAAELSLEADLCHKSQVIRGGVALARLSQLIVTSDRKFGTGRLPSFLSFRSFFLSPDPPSPAVRSQPSRCDR